MLASAVKGRVSLFPLTGARKIVGSQPVARQLLLGGHGVDWRTP
jgi:hypothetical protein